MLTVSNAVLMYSATVIVRSAGSFWWKPVIFDVLDVCMSFVSCIVLMSGYVLCVRCFNSSILFIMPFMLFCGVDIIVGCECVCVMYCLVMVCW